MNAQDITHAIGIDISDGSLELADIHEQRDGVPVLAGFARVSLPEHVIVHGHIQDQAHLTDALHALLQDASIDPRTAAIVTALPDAQVLTKILPIPQTGGLLSYDTIAHSARSIYRTLGYRIKDPLIQWKYRDLPGRREGELTLFVAQKESVRQWQSFFRSFGSRLAVVEMESLALERALIQKAHAHEAIAIIDFGFRMTMVSVFDAAGLRYTHTLESGGYDLTVALMQGLDCSIAEAERLKTSIGITGTGQKKVHTILRAATDELLQRVSLSLADFGQTITSVRITGGGARLRGIRTATESRLKLPTKRGISWLSHHHTTRGHLNTSQIDPSHTLYYTGALGLALRGMNRYTLAKGINFLDA